MKQTEWKIIYSAYTGIAEKAINLLSKEGGKYLIRNSGLLRLHVLPCEKESEYTESKNAFFVSCINDSPLIQKYVDIKEVPENGYLVKVIKNPSDETGRFVILTAHTQQELFYSVVSFLDDYIYKYAPNDSHQYRPDLIFDGIGNHFSGVTEQLLPECCYTEVPEFKTRSIFTWGHSINNYKAYIDNMARLKLNELIIWNDFIPLNISNIIDYAHLYGIKVILGYSWGWREIPTNDDITAENIEKVQNMVIKKYKDEYSLTNCDGIYFQTFTEAGADKYVNGKPLARYAIDMINSISKELKKITPGLRLLFGLHSFTVKDHLDIISELDKDVEIYWENLGGTYPFNYGTSVNGHVEEYEKTNEFLKKVLELRGGTGSTIVFKSIMMLDWSPGNFIVQRGPYIMGENAEVITEHDRACRTSSWRQFAADWIKNGNDAAKVVKLIKDNKKDNSGVCIAGTLTLDAGICLPVAIYAQMFRNPSPDYADILHTVTRRECVRFE